MGQNDTVTTEHDKQQKERAEVVAKYGELWLQVLKRSGVTDDKTTAELLQVCAACYLDGVHQGSRLTIEQIATAK